MKQILIVIRENNNNILVDINLSTIDKNIVETKDSKIFEIKNYDIENFDNSQFFMNQANILSHKINEYLLANDFQKSNIILSFDTFCFIEKIKLPKIALKNVNSNIDQELANLYKSDYKTQFLTSYVVNPIISDKNTFQSTILLIRKRIYERILYIINQLDAKLTKVVYYPDMILSTLVKDKLIDKTTPSIIVTTKDDGLCHIMVYLNNSLSATSYGYLELDKVEEWIASITESLKESKSAQRFKDKKVVPLSISKSFYDIFYPIIKEMEKDFGFFYEYEISNLYIASAFIETEYFDLCFNKRFPDLKVERISLDPILIHSRNTKTAFTLPLRIKDAKK